jgi:hypothetical protein
MALGSDDPGNTSAPQTRCVGVKPASLASHKVAVPNNGFTYLTGDCCARVTHTEHKVKMIKRIGFLIVYYRRYFLAG